MTLEMTTEATVELAPTLNTPDPAQQTPEVAAPETETPIVDESAAPGESEEDQRDKTIRKLERRVNHKHSQAAAAEERARMLEQRLSQYETKEAPQPERQDGTVDPVALAREMAKEIAAVTSITDKANGIAKDGEKRFPGDFKAALQAVVEEAGPLFDNRGLPTAIGDAVMDADDPAALLHHLGKNPDLAAELQGLSPARLGRRLAQIETAIKPKAAVPKAVSNAPAPARPISAARSTSGDPASMSQSEYEAHRASQGAGWARRR